MNLTERLRKVDQEKAQAGVDKIAKQTAQKEWIKKEEQRLRSRASELFRPFVEDLNKSFLKGKGSVYVESKVNASDRRVSKKGSVILSWNTEIDDERETIEGDSVKVTIEESSWDSEREPDEIILEAGLGNHVLRVNHGDKDWKNKIEDGIVDAYAKGLTHSQIDTGIPDHY